MICAASTSGNREQRDGENVLLAIVLMGVMYWPGALLASGFSIVLLVASNFFACVSIMVQRFLMLLLSGTAAALTASMVLCFLIIPVICSVRSKIQASLAELGFRSGIMGDGGCGFAEMNWLCNQGGECKT